MARLKVFVFDHGAAGGSPARPRPPSLQHHGDMLLQALLSDLGALPDVDVITMPQPDAAFGVGGVGEAAVDYLVASLWDSASAPVSPRTERATSSNKPLNTLPNKPSNKLPNKPPSTSPDTSPGMHAGTSPDSPSIAPAGLSLDPQRVGAHFAAGMQAADAVWPLVRESEGMLERLSRGILHGKRILLGSAPGAVEIAASKLRLARVLADGGVAAVATYSPHAPLPQDRGPWVVKPDDGAGCLDTRLFNDCNAALAWIRASATDGYVLQPFVGGRLGSLSLICRDGAARVLACNQERVAMRDNHFHYLGSVVNGLSDNDGALARLAQQVAAALPGLWGYVGVDFVLGAHGAVVLDVNPRLTAAYAGLHASIGCNPAGLVLDLLQGPAAMPAPATVPMRRAVSVDIGIA